MDNYRHANYNLGIQYQPSQTFYGIVNCTVKNIRRIKEYRPERATRDGEMPPRKSTVSTFAGVYVELWHQKWSPNFEAFGSSRSKVFNYN